jgi:uncharacterized protein YoaH (UPF0181 family)
MVKVLENKVIDLDILPGTSQIEAQKLLREQLAQGVPSGQAAASVAQIRAGNAGDVAASAAEGGVQKIQVNRQQLDELVGDQLSTEEKNRIMEEQKSVGGVVVDAAGNVFKGLAGTVGGVVKGVGDTGFNTVHSLGSGVANIGTGLAGGLTDTAKVATGYAPQTTSIRADQLPAAAADGGGEAAAEGTTNSEESGAPSQRNKPRKIEMRSTPRTESTDTEETTDAAEQAEPARPSEQGSVSSSTGSGN